MFTKARLKLTVWYLAIIVVISSFFSLIIYSNVSNQIERLVQMHNDRIRLFQESFGFGDYYDSFRGPPQISTQELLNQKYQLAYSLLLVNLFILTTSGLAGYFLAGRTLSPIKKMLDDQNQFISDASHELRTPLATLQAEMEASLLQKNITNSQARQLITSNLEEMSTLKRLTNNLLALTNGQKTDTKNSFKTVALYPVIAQVVAKFKTILANQQIIVTLPRFSAKVLGDRDSLIELFTILIDNAIKYSPKNTRITIAGKSITSHHYQISVTDQGIGIDQNDLPHIFDRFYRADKSRSTTDGFGLGLAIAKKIVSNHHGSISVTSQPAKGSTFDIILPLSQN